jgi:hypothetical protein
MDILTAFSERVEFILLISFRRNQMKSKIPILVLAAVAALAVSFPLFAHHGASDYDMTQTTTVKGGAVTQFEFVNPHIWIDWDFKNANGVLEHWRAEGTTPNILFRNGWTRESLKPGMELQAVEGNRCKNGDTCMRLRKVILGDGTELPVPQ